MDKKFKLPKKLKIINLINNTDNNDNHDNNDIVVIMNKHYSKIDEKSTNSTI